MSDEKINDFKKVYATGVEELFKKSIGIDPEALSSVLNDASLTRLRGFACYESCLRIAEDENLDSETKRLKIGILKEQAKICLSKGYNATKMNHGDIASSAEIDF